MSSEGDREGNVKFARAMNRHSGTKEKRGKWEEDGRVKGEVEVGVDKGRER